MYPNSESNVVELILKWWWAVVGGGGRWGGCSVDRDIFGLRGFSFREFFGDRTISDPLTYFYLKYV